VCGIFGIVARRGAVDPALLDRGTDAVAHRGPDGRGTLVRGNVGLGHRRLSILDTSAAGAQPMRHASAPLFLVFNGEIYNYLELRVELAAAGHVFHTGTDTEVVLAAYQAWGRRCVERFNGMWAFALLDETAGQLFCSRDRFGVKPLFWIDTPDAFAFGSEMRQLLPLLPRRTGHAGAVRDFLASGLSDHFEDEAWVRGVWQLAPGCSLVLDLKPDLKLDPAGGAPRVERHYTIHAAAQAPASPADAAGQLQALLLDAVKLRLRSDVRVGTCLSGGLDSSAIATQAAALQPAAAERFRAITAISELPENSEEPYARQVVERAALEWIAVRPSGADFEAALDEAVQTQEVPFGGPSVVMQHFVMQAARAHGVSVLLDGQGADECWLGYDRHAALWLRERARRGLGALLGACREGLAQQGHLTLPRLAGLLAAPWLPGAVGLGMTARYPGLRQALQLPAAWSQYLRQLGDPRATQAMDLSRTSLPMLLRYADRSSMHHGVEVRLPFLDWRVVELSLATPVAFKFHQGWSKWPLRQAAAARLPQDVAWRKRKLGFEAPDRLWLQALRPRMKSAVAASPMLADLFDRPRLLAGFDALARPLAWRLFSLAAWEAHQGIGGLE
jgi:asparagine synthase (glutamine-hydrolysing)